MMKTVESPWEVRTLEDLSSWAKVSAGDLIDAKVVRSPPANFWPATKVSRAWELTNSPFGARKRLHGTPAQKAGVRFERAVAEKVKRHYLGRDVRHGQWIGFVDNSATLRSRTCQPDILVVQSDFVLVFEVKVSHCEKAWWQLFRLYKPVLEALYARPVVCVELCKSFDPAVFTPESPVPFFSLRSFDARLASTRDASVFYVVQEKV